MFYFLTFTQTNLCIYVYMYIHKKKEKPGIKYLALPTVSPPPPQTAKSYANSLHREEATRLSLVSL